MYHDIEHLHPQLLSLPRFLRYDQCKILKVKVTTARSKVKSRSHHDSEHLHPLTHVPTKYQLPAPFSFQDIPWTRF